VSFSRCQYLKHNQMNVTCSMASSECEEEGKEEEDSSVLSPPTDLFKHVFYTSTCGPMRRHSNLVYPMIRRLSATFSKFCLPFLGSREKNAQENVRPSSAERKQPSARRGMRRRRLQEGRGGGGGGYDR